MEWQLVFLPVLTFHSALFPSPLKLCCPGSPFLLRCAQFSRSEDTAKPVMLSSTQDISIRRPCLLPKNEVFSKTYPDWKTTYSSLLKSTYPSIAFFYSFSTFDTDSCSYHQCSSVSQKWCRTSSEITPAQHYILKSVPTHSHMLHALEDIGQE